YFEAKQSQFRLYIRRGKTALWVTLSLLALALVVLTVGLISATRTDNVPVSGYYPGITLSFGAFLGIVGIHLVENRRPMLVAAIIFISIGVIASFFCAIVDGIIDIRPLQEDMCDYYSSGSAYVFDNYYNEVHSLKSCKIKLRSNTCYCCYLYNCDNTEYYPHYYEFTGVSSCWDVIHLHRLLWASVVLNVIALFLGIIDAAILGAYKDMPQGATQDPGGYMLTPNAPALYGSSYGPFEKPPPVGRLHLVEAERSTRLFVG
uniref:Transmembrane protein 255B n=1 Tax=Fundulus heteroclitus TaxID=8078 RepID=A0A3Q2QIX9_FUNHE